ncbi:deoxyuridine 5'-triphosphate nucleotidohydrolase, mitochondrial isoform X1 [Marmota monax]|uniref:deoxyuridine 5'-triphosphate nucleotidohydrolase, mitochondrial isoform X1 n=1 Tax=Marmota monax TaxID=9995 RepID=UPI001EAFA724|nr:deoxyuridine 5'-triphosphate nucleotidohydrolase, mitochondrial isoform X1 [Marmota monax]
MTALLPRPALGCHFSPSLLRLAFKDARRKQPGAWASRLSRPGPPFGPTQLAPPRSLSRAGTPFPEASEAWDACGTGTPAKAWILGPEEVTAISPSKRARPAEDGGLRLRFVRLSEHATAPTRGSARAAGYDLYSAYDYIVPPMEKALVKTDIQIALPSGCYGRIAPRSGLAAKYFIDVGAGVIDEDYRGNIGVVLFNFGKEKFEVKKGDRIAQLICERIFYPDIEEVQVLNDTERGSGGFGSTGKN